jgi:cytochrome c553
MKKMILQALMCAGLIGSGMQATQAHGDAIAGKKKFYTCEGCHNVAGYTNTYPTYNVPRIGGQHADYVVSALKAYRDDERKHGSMKGNANNLSDQDMADIAVFVSKFRGMNSTLPVTGDPAAGKQKAAACASCHGEDGNSENPMYPRLAGQYESFLIRALKEYKSGARTNPMMMGFASMLNDTDMKDIAAYYASQKKGLTLPQD